MKINDKIGKDKLKLMGFTHKPDKGNLEVWEKDGIEIYRHGISSEVRAINNGGISVDSFLPVTAE